jgi:hypothetical protein
MKTALRVLAAVTYRSEPDSADVTLLRSIAPAMGEWPVEELAREIIQAILRQRAPSLAKRVTAH